MNRFQKENGTLSWRKNHEILLIQPWGKDSFRVRSTLSPEILDTPWALLQPAVVKPCIEIKDSGALIQNGKITAKISPNGAIGFYRSADDSSII